MVTRTRLLIFLLSALCLWSTGSAAQIRDPFDPFDLQEDLSNNREADANKSAKQLVREALILQQSERFLDARTKLLLALEKDPGEFMAHLMLADYYLRQVGHFRLALRYTKQALSLFTQDYGKPPYSDPAPRFIHMDLLNLLSNVRLNLDDYQGSLDALDEYQKLGYYETWLPASRAWVLMKLGRLDEAIKVARMGMLAGADDGRTLNVLGILLSMTQDKEASLRVFNQAIQQELALGKMGSPATPLNNAGEVYRELFREETATRFWDRSLRLPDGCEHVLPSLNLALLNMEETKYAEANATLNNFESCTAQFPLRNGEEHRALVHLARGRIALHTGRVDEAITHLEAASQRRQWFGKIGTSQKDLEAAATISLAQALRAKNSHLRRRLPAGLAEKLQSWKERCQNGLRAWWLMRRVRGVMVEDLKDMEDLYIRNTDSLLEYQTLGEVLAGFPPRLLVRRLKIEQQKDKRTIAAVYYKTYLAESYLKHSRIKEARKLLDEVLTSARPTFDSAIEVQALLLWMKTLRTADSSYADLAYRVFSTSRSELLNSALPLPVNFVNLDEETLTHLRKSAFLPDNSNPLPCNISQDQDEKGLFILHFACATGPTGNVRVKAKDLLQAVNNLAASVFVRDLE